MTEASNPGYILKNAGILESLDFTSPSTAMLSSQAHTLAFYNIGCATGSVIPPFPPRRVDMNTQGLEASSSSPEKLAVASDRSKPEQSCNFVDA